MIEKALNLSIIEVFLGSILHGLQIPFAGHFLSVNQGLFLYINNDEANSKFQSAKMSFEISMIVAIMKSFSPAGRRLGPMISISAQGFLYAIGTLILGRNFMGQVLSIALLSIWSFIQPLVTFFLIYGSDLIKALSYYQEKLNLPKTGFLYIVLWAYLLKVILAILCLFLLKIKGTELFFRYEKFLTSIKLIPKKDSQKLHPLKGAIKDTLRPSLLLSYFLMGTFFYFHQKDFAITLWLILRSLSIAFVLFFCLRSPLISEKIEKLAKKNQYLYSLYQKANTVSHRLKEELG